MRRFRTLMMPVATSAVLMVAGGLEPAAARAMTELDHRPGTNRCEDSQAAYADRTMSLAQNAAGGSNRPTGQFGQTTPDDTRPSNRFGQTPPDDGRSSGRVGATPPDDSRPSNRFGANPPDDNRPSRRRSRVLQSPNILGGGAGLSTQGPASMGTPSPGAPAAGPGLLR